jgi:hypothetical protein
LTTNHSPGASEGGPQRDRDEGPRGADAEARRRREWAFHAAVALACSVYLNLRTRIVPRIGEWYAPDSHPAVLLQLRAWFSGRLALAAHPAGSWYDFVWGRGGMHTPWGLGVPILALPLHVVARAIGAPGFPDQMRFLVFYATTAAILSRAFHRPRARGAASLIASGATAAFVVLFPTFVGMVGSRRGIYEQTIAIGALWSLVLLASVLLLLERTTTRRFVLVCAASAFAVVLRAPLAAYGLTTLGLALIIAHRKGLTRRGLVAGIAASAMVIALYLAGNYARFGSPFEAGYANLVSLPSVNRLTRWGLGFAYEPLDSSIDELFATLFLLRPVATTYMTTSPGQVPVEVAPFAHGERWREYSSPTFDLIVFAACLVALAVVAWRVVRGRLWRRDRRLGGEVATVIGIWALPPAVVLFAFYARIGNLATRYVVDFYPAFAAALVCSAMAFVEAVRARVPRRAWIAELAIAGLAVGYLSLPEWRGWPPQSGREPTDRTTLEVRLAAIDDASMDQPIPPPHIQCEDPRGPDPVYSHLAEWKADCTLRSGMVFAFPWSPCVTFTFQPVGANGWGPGEVESLQGFRANADFDALVTCGPPKGEGETRSITMCEPRPPPFLLDGMRLYATATLDRALLPIDRLRLMRIDAAPACP